MKKEHNVINIRLMNFLIILLLVAVVLIPNCILANPPTNRIQQPDFQSHRIGIDYDTDEMMSIVGGMYSESVAGLLYPLLGEEDFCNLNNLFILRNPGSGHSTSPYYPPPPPILAQGDGEVHTFEERFEDLEYGSNEWKALTDFIFNYKLRGSSEVIKFTGSSNFTLNVSLRIDGLDFVGFTSSTTNGYFCDPADYPETSPPDSQEVFFRVPFDITHDGFLHVDVARLQIDTDEDYCVDDDHGPLDPEYFRLPFTQVTFEVESRESGQPVIVDCNYQNWLKVMEDTGTGTDYWDYDDDGDHDGVFPILAGGYWLEVSYSVDKFYLTEWSLAIITSWRWDGLSHWRLLDYIDDFEIALSFTV